MNVPRRCCAGGIFGLLPKQSAKVRSCPTRGCRCRCGTSVLHWAVAQQCVSFPKSHTWRIRLMQTCQLLAETLPQCLHRAIVCSWGRLGPHENHEIVRFQCRPARPVSFSNLTAEPSFITDNASIRRRCVPVRGSQHHSFGRYPISLEEAASVKTQTSPVESEETVPRVCKFPCHPLLSEGLYGGEPCSFSTLLCS
jgi:hypothetical protein